MTYSEKLKDPRRQRRRLEVFNRDGFTCRDCGATNKPLHVHHCFYERGAPWDTSAEFLLTLCDGCHVERQDAEDLAKATLGRIFASKTKQQMIDFVAEMEKECACDHSRARVLHDMSVYDSADYRWFEHALDNPEFRRAYEDATGKRTDWNKGEEIK